MYNINLLLVHLTIEQVMMVLNSAGIRDRPFFFMKEIDRIVTSILVSSIYTTWMIL